MAGRWFEAEVWQDGMMVASVSAPNEESMRREITHYAMIYAQDGPVQVKIKGEKR